MPIFWREEALGDLKEILAYYHLNAGPTTAKVVLDRIVCEIVGLQTFPERIRASDRSPGACELVVTRLPYIVFLKVLHDKLVILAVVHTARKFPG